MTDKPDLDAIEERWREAKPHAHYTPLADFMEDIPALTAALREARARIERLESENFDLEELLGVSEGQVNDLKNERTQHHEEQNQ